MIWLRLDIFWHVTHLYVSVHHTVNVANCRRVIQVVNVVWSYAWRPSFDKLTNSVRIGERGHVVSSMPTFFQPLSGYIGTCENVLLIHVALECIVTPKYGAPRLVWAAQPIG